MRKNFTYIYTIRKHRKIDSSVSQTLACVIQTLLSVRICICLFILKGRIGDIEKDFHPLVDVPGQSKVFHSCLPCWLQRPKQLDHLLLVFPGCYQGTEPEVKQSGPDLILQWDAGVKGCNFTGHTSSCNLHFLIIPCCHSTKNWTMRIPDIDHSLSIFSAWNHC